MLLAVDLMARHTGEDLIDEESVTVPIVFPLQLTAPTPHTPTDS
jgi:hypothetical protein